MWLLAETATSHEPLVARRLMSANDAMNGRPYRLLTTAVFTIVVITLASCPTESWAYVDPNAGGFAWQILAPLASIFLSFLFYCRNEIRRLVKSVRDRWKAIESPSTACETRSEHEARK
jgi:hypothetical protein